MRPAYITVGVNPIKIAMLIATLQETGIKPRSISEAIRIAVDIVNKNIVSEETRKRFTTVDEAAGYLISEGYPTSQVTSSKQIKEELVSSITFKSIDTSAVEKIKNLFTSEDENDKMPEEKQ